MSLVGFTASNVTSGYWPACALALLAIAAIQPWSAAGAEKPMVDRLARRGVAAGGAGRGAGPACRASAGVLLVQAASAAPAPSAERAERGSGAGDGWLSDRT